MVTSYDWPVIHLYPSRRAESLESQRIESDNKKNCPVSVSEASEPVVVGLSNNFCQSVVIGLDAEARLAGYSQPTFV